MNDKSHPDRSCRPASIGRETAQHDSFEARIPGSYAEKSKNRREDLLEIGRNRGLDCFIEEGKVNAIHNRGLRINSTGKTIQVLFFYSAATTFVFHYFHFYLLSSLSSTPSTPPSPSFFFSFCISYYFYFSFQPFVPSLTIT